MTAPDRPGDRDRQQAAEMHAEWLRTGQRWPEMVAAALAAARADGDRLRQRIEALADELEREAVRVPQVGRIAMADRLRAALDDEQ